MPAEVVAVHSKAVHAFSKDTLPWIDLVEGHGVFGDAHYGVTVKHRSRVARDPTQPNLRQVHLLHEELIRALALGGLAIEPGQMGENITTRGIDLLALAEGTILRVGDHVRVRVTGLRNPCAQIETFKTGLLAAVLGKGPDGSVIRKAGVMGVVVESGRVAGGASISVESEPEVRRALRPV